MMYYSGSDLGGARLIRNNHRCQLVVETTCILKKEKTELVRLSFDMKRTILWIISGMNFKMISG